MLDEILDNPALEKYFTTFKVGQTIFLEGDPSQDLYILVSGQVDILKGNNKITEVSEAGSLFGEMSFLLGAKRTASVKAGSDVKVIRIPKEEVTLFLNEFSAVGGEISRLLAQRLDNASQIVYGLKEFCNQIPDAVILTDEDGKVLVWNSAAERVYGREWRQLHRKSADEIYEEPDVYRKFIEEVQSKYPVSEKVLKIRHPEKGIRYISTSTTVLYDGHHNFQGVLSLGRDVTSVQKLERRYRRARYWLIPSFIVLGMMALAIFFGYPYFSKGYKATDIKKEYLRNQLSKDYLFLKTLLIKPFSAGERSQTTKQMKEFFGILKGSGVPYKGLVLLDRDKKVFDAFSIKGEKDITTMAGSSYAGVVFEGDKDSLHRVLTPYHVDSRHPMGDKGLEIAFVMANGSGFLGWVVFQMDSDILKREYDMDEEDLKGFHFKKKNP
ncbi:MAG: cyclic nucleotide-binding domain-containing protein [Desulfobacteraceae bacterium]|nr:cyclic nucleotide-binding domain-containing protein [Desulfobacteraceae bacterium]